MELDSNENPFQTIVAGEFLNAIDGMVCLLNGKSAAVRVSRISLSVWDPVLTKRRLPPRKPGGSMLPDV